MLARRSPWLPSPPRRANAGCPSGRFLIPTYTSFSTPVRSARLAPLRTAASDSQGSGDSSADPRGLFVDTLRRSRSNARSDVGLATPYGLATGAGPAIPPPAVLPSKNENRLPRDPISRTTSRDDRGTGCVDDGDVSVMFSDAIDPTRLRRPSSNPSPCDATVDGVAASSIDALTAASSIDALAAAALPRRRRSSSGSCGAGDSSACDSSKTAGSSAIADAPGTARSCRLCSARTGSSTCAHWCGSVPCAGPCSAAASSMSPHVLHLPCAAATPDCTR
ncbi:hypothetical protein DL89DRAFT_131967 [Linderina pennispora]|uniref:Uncharacterized protein n=1 Tax=Linderina pennispora TaxID=61395 RepID=A0A1Y1VV44_9FUNG|nr:uncharacterized protein DL89DRAFT_131967 [Linderina pennispora]ORX65150.1 hypothetical protein DL89DRAFT_131967 [Linderina pennispora]